MQSRNTVLDSGSIQDLLFLALSQTQTSLISFSNSSDFLTTLQQAFGDQFDTSVALDLASSWQKGNFSIIPTISIVEAKVLQGSNGAFARATDTIYI